MDEEEKKLNTRGIIELSEKEKADYDERLQVFIDNDDMFGFFECVKKDMGADIAIEVINEALMDAEDCENYEAAKDYWDVLKAQNLSPLEMQELEEDREWEREWIKEDELHAALGTDDDE